MDNFFAAMEAVANNPTSQPERQVMLSEAETLANRFNYVDARLSELAENMNEQMSVYVVDINQYAEDIAQLNQQIRGSSGRLEARQMIYSINVTEQSNRSSKLVRIDAVQQDDGSINVSLTTGIGW